MRVPMNKSSRLSSAIRTLLFVGLITPLLGIVGPLSLQAHAATKGSVAFNGQAEIEASGFPGSGTGQFTYELWFKTNGISSAYSNWSGWASLIQTRSSRWNNDGFHIVLKKQANQISGKSTFSFELMNPATASIAASSTGYITDGDWHHFAITREIDKKYRLYLDGALKGTSANAVSDAQGNMSSTLIHIGEAFKGNISNFRFTNGTVLYSDGYSVPTGPLSANGTSQVLFPFNYGLAESLTATSYQGTPPTLRVPSGQDSTNNVDSNYLLQSFGVTTDSANPFPPVVTFDNNGGSGTMTPQSASTSTSLTVNSFTRTNFTFLKWNTSRDGTGTSYLNGATFPFDLDTTLYAQWSSDSVGVLFDSNGGSAVDSTTVVIGSAINSAPTAPTKAGYNFGGWKASVGGSAVTFPYYPTLSKEYAASVSSAALSDLGRYENKGLWNSSTWYGPNRGTTPSSTRDFVTYADGRKYIAIRESNNSVLSSPTRLDGYYLVPLDTSTVLTAIWTVAAQTVTYSGGVGSSGTAPTQASVAPNETFTVAGGSTILKTGYTFSKWKDAGNVEYLPGSSYSVTDSAVTLTAQWTLNNYVVTFSAGSNGSISGTTPQNIDHGTSTSQVIAVPNANYHFVTWSDASTENPRTISSVETTTSLSATFAIDTYTATYNSGGNGSISGTAVQTINHGETATAVTAIPSANYHFVSWNDGVLTATRLDAAVTSSLSKTASFAIDAHAITFNANGGSGGSTVSVNYNENAVASAPSLSRSQYTFAGWAETVTASSIATWTVVGPKTLYGLWTPNIYSITYNTESGTALTSSETFTVGSAPIQLQSATRAGYKFNGWYTDKTGGSLLGITGANYTPSDTATVHAQWTQASLVGLSSPTSFGTIIATSGNDGGISATRSGTKAEIDYFADSLPDNTVITAYLQGSTAYAASQLTGVTNLLLSVVVAWKAPDETVPVVDPNKNAIRLKITNPSIKRGAKVYSIAGDSSTILTTATQDGFVVIELREDPEIVIANPVEAPAPPVPPSITAAPAVDNSAAENAAKLKAEEEAKKAAELKAAQEQAAKDLEAAREKAEAEIKAAQDAADLESRLKAEADARLAAEIKAKEDAEIAADLASQKIVPNVTLYSISPNLKLSVYDTTYLKSYVATLKSKATVTCIGYIYPKNTTLAKAKVKATSQATAVCKLIKAQRKSLTTKVVVYPASKAPKAAAGAKWVAVSYRVDGFKS